VEKASKHMPNITESKVEEMDRMEFAGLTDNVIEEKCKKYIYIDASNWCT